MDPRDGLPHLRNITGRYIIELRDNNNNNNDRLTAFDPGQPG